MIYSVQSKKSLEQVDESLRAAAQNHKFGVLNVLDMKHTLANKGFDLGHECRVYDVCNPRAAMTALGYDMKASTVLPCRISVFSHEDGLTLATVHPADLMRATGIAGVEPLAVEVENEIKAIMEEAAN